MLSEMRKRSCILQQGIGQHIPEVHVGARPRRQLCEENSECCENTSSILFSDTPGSIELTEQCVCLAPEYTVVSEQKPVGGERAVRASVNDLNKDPYNDQVRRRLCWYLVTSQRQRCVITDEKCEHQHYMAGYHRCVIKIGQRTDG
ncbi:hypothetical protein STEG23_030138, partial [Scotinomys teguina]